MSFCLRNARIVTADAVFSGSLCCDGGVVTRVDEGPSAVGEDFEGDFLLPGLVEIHTDNIEKHFIPRNGVRWPAGLSAILAHDAHMTVSGVTTVLDALSAGEFSSRRLRREIFQASIAALEQAAEHGLLRAEHLLHIRCEMADTGVVEMFESVQHLPAIRLVSIMDHTPGQRKWADVAKFRAHHSDKRWTEEQAAEEIRRLQEIQRTHAGPNRRTIIERCRQRNLPLASHDDTTEAHAEETAAAGMRISEFPTTMAAARRAKELGLSIVMGAPNVVRRGSHSGNVSALELARQNLLDILSSDYMPASLLHAAFLLCDDLGLPLPQAMATVTRNPSQALGLDDRGVLAKGKRADFLRVRRIEGVPVVCAAWREGRRIM